MDAATLAGHIRKLKPRCGSHIVVAIDGAAGSGKTTGKGGANTAGCPENKNRVRCL